MISDSDHQKRVSYDAQGNIVILGAEPSVTPPVRHALFSLLYELRDEIQFLQHDARGACQRVLNFFKQPVIAPNWRSKPKEYSRWRLFVSDIFRFGSTFAMLFSILFIALNYHSFLQLSSNYLDPLRALRHDDAFASDITDLLTRSQKPTSELDLLALLPSVGPPYNRLIIPKLNLNVPIAIPPSDALLAEDWEKLEMDIQKSLEDGVVHYPGTARPGQAGNFFVTGHSSYYPWAPGDYKSVFAKLQLLNEGDEYWVYYNGDRFRYKIFEKQEVKPSNVSVLDQPLAKRISTLMTCTPTGTTLRRLILTAQELDPETGTPMRVGERTKRDLPTIKPAALPI